jgi:hypothetical protein
MVARNKRYLIWFWLLNLTLAQFGAAAFRMNAHALFDHSSYAQGLTRGFDLGVFAEFLFRPESGQFGAMTTPAVFFAFLFFVATTLFLPGVFAGYASTYRLPRQEFFRACGANLWRFIRLMFVAGIVMIIATVLLFSLHGVLERKAENSTDELLLPWVRGVGLFVIFLIMSCFRIWFDLAEADVVLSDQNAVRRSIAAGFRHAFRGMVGLLTSYVVTTIVAALILVGGLWTWLKHVSPESLLGAFLISQLTLFLLLIPRFWQRGIVVAYWKEKMMVPVSAPVVIAPPIESTPIAPPPPPPDVTPPPPPDVTPLPGTP